MSKRFISLVLILTHLMIILTSCTKTVTKYKTVRVPKKVTKYRTVKRSKLEWVDVPYEEEYDVPKYKTIYSKINPTNSKYKIAIFPFLNSTDKPDADRLLSKKIYRALLSHKDFYDKYSLLSVKDIKSTIGKKDLNTLSPDDIKKLRQVHSLSRIITGNIKKYSSNNTNLNLEVLSTKNLKQVYKKKYSGRVDRIVNRITNAFFDKKIQDGYKTVCQTKYKLEEKTVYEDVEEPYETTEFVEEKKAYEEEVGDNKKTFWLIMGVLVYPLIILPLGVSLS